MIFLSLLSHWLIYLVKEWGLSGKVIVRMPFDKLKAILRSEPVLLAPNFNEEFKLAVDASDVGAGGIAARGW